MALEKQERSKGRGRSGVGGARSGVGGSAARHNSPKTGSVSTKKGGTVGLSVRGRFSRAMSGECPSTLPTLFCAATERF